MLTCCGLEWWEENFIRGRISFRDFFACAMNPSGLPVYWIPIYNYATLYRCMTSDVFDFFVLDLYSALLCSFLKRLFSYFPTYVTLFFCIFSFTCALTVLRLLRMSWFCLLAAVHFYSFYKHMLTVFYIMNINNQVNLAY